MRVAFLLRPSNIKIPGGDVVQLINTAGELEKLGCSILVTSNTYELVEFAPEIIHISGLNLVRQTLNNVQYISRELPNCKIVMSTIYVSYYEFESKVRKNIFLKFLLRLFGYTKYEYLKEIFRNKSFLFSDFINILSPNFNSNFLKCLKNIDIFLPNSELEKRQVQSDFNINDSYFKVVPNGAGFGSFNLDYSIPETGYILCVARIEPLKNQIALASACKSLGLKLVFIGGVNKNQLSYYSEFLKVLDKDIRYLGSMDHSRLGIYYKECLAFAMPSYFETFGMTALEASLFSKPILLGDRGYAKDVFMNSALYCDPFSHDSIVSGLELVLKRLKSGGASIKKTTITWEDVGNLTYTAYQDILNKTNFSYQKSKEL